MLICVIGLATWGLCEVLAWGYLGFESGGGLNGVHSSQRSLAVSGVPQGKLGESIHPYVGWVLNPDIHSDTTADAEVLRINRWGFSGNEDTVPHRAADRVIIGIAGGSVAWQMSRDAEITFRQMLQQDPRFARKALRLVRLAMPGYKQPQQLMALNYLLTLGFEFDAIINIDGYNEVALTACENYPMGVALAYPRAWHARMQDVVDPREYAVSERLFAIRAKRQQLAQDARDSVFHWSPLRNLVWMIRDARLNNELIVLGEGLRDRRTRRGRGFAADGPVDDDLDPSAMEAEVVTIWERSSRQMHYLCDANGIRYLHCLQPNQHLEGSKPLSDEEREEFYAPHECASQQVNRLYPFLIAAGNSLSEEGVQFHDLTQLFGEVEETIYADCFCHYNQRGNDMLTEAVATRLLQLW